MRCPHCKEEFTPTVEQLAKTIEEIYPQDLFKKHPISWVRRLLKYLSGMDHHVLVDEDHFTKWKEAEER